MFMKDIEKLFTDKVNEYLSNGYIFHCTTMSGNQGEIAKVDLYKGDDVIRILLDSHFQQVDMLDSYVSLVVGRNTDKLYGTTIDTIWSYRLDVIEEQRFYSVGRDKRFYVSMEEAEKCEQKRSDRYYASWMSDRQILPEKANRIVWSFMKRQYDCKTIRLNQIEQVYKKVRSDGKVWYYVKAKGKVFPMNKGAEA